MKNKKNRRLSDILEGSKTQRIVKTLKYMGKEVGTVTTITRPYINEPQTLDLIDKMPPHVKIHMEKLLP